MGLIIPSPASILPIQLTVGYLSANELVMMAPLADQVKTSI
jgi:hypothetical protein